MESTVYVQQLNGDWVKYVNNAKMKKNLIQRYLYDKNPHTARKCKSRDNKKTSIIQQFGPT